MSEPSSADRDPFEVVAESFLARFRSGQRPSIDEYAARHPELAEQIRELLPALVMVEQDLTIDRDPVPSGSRPPLPSAPFRERRLGDYRILREVGRGGMGVVYEAEQVSLGRRVALKVLPGHHSGDRTGLERFRREAKAAARLHHTNIVPVFEVGSDGDVAYYAMQFIQGQGLDQVIDELIRLRDHAPNPGAAKSPAPTEFIAAPATAERAVGRIAESLLLGRIATEVAAPIADPSTADPEVTERIDRDATHSPGLGLASRGPSRPHSGATSGSRALLPGGSEVSTTYLSGRRATFFRSVAGIGRQAAQVLAYAHAGGGDGTARVWDASTGQLLLGLEHSDGVACVAFSPDGRRIVTGTNTYGSKGSGDVKVWDAATGRELLTLQRHGPGVLGVKFSPDGSRILTGSQDGTAKVWDAATGRELLVLEGHAGALTSVAFGRDGRRILTGGQDRTARVWDAATGRELLSLRGHTAGVQGVAFSPDGDRIVTASSDRSAKVWDAETGQELLAFKGQPEAVWSVAFSPDGQRIVTGLASANATASIWYAGRGQDVLVLKGQGEPLSSAAFSPDGERIFGWDTQKRIMAWSAADGRPIDPRNPPAMPRPGPARSADGFLTARPEGKTIVVTDKRPSPRENTWPLPDATERERHRVELARSLRRGEIELARSLLNSGTAAFGEGRLADANVRLQQASQRLRALRGEFPDDPLLAPMLGLSHGFLASTLRDLKRPGEALPHARESLSMLESIHDARPNNLFNMACGCAMLSALEDRASPADREKLQARGVAYLRRAVEGDRTRIPPLIPADRDLDPLRSRADFRGLMADLAFPRDPFRQPSPLALFESFSSEEKRELDGLSAKIALEPSAFLAWRSRGGFFARRGAWPAAAADYRRALDLNPPSKWADSNFDNVFALESAVVLLKSGDVDGYRRLARTMLDRFAESNIPSIADATAKVNSLLPPPEQDLGRLGLVAQNAVDAGRGDGILPWCLLVRGMAAYRAGDFAGAVEWLDKAGASSPGPDHLTATKSYQAMASSRLGRAETARALLSEAGGLTATRVAQKDVGGGWHDLWIAELARREAEALVNSTQPQTADPVGP